MESEREDDSEGPDDFIEVPSCIESLTNSAGQLRQLAHQASNYYSKILLCYGCINEPTNIFQGQGQDVQDVASSSTGTAKGRRCCKSSSFSKVQQSNLTTLKSHDHCKRRVRKGNPVDLKSLVNRNQKLASLNSLVNILPCLSEFCTFLERCFATVEVTIKRVTYYLNLASQQDKRPAIIKYETFQLTPDIRLDVIFISLMDLLLTLISLEKTLCDKTTIQDDLDLLDATCRQLFNGEDNDKEFCEDIPDEGQISRLIEFVGNIKLTLGLEYNESLSIFKQCINHVQHLNLILSKDKTQPGFKYLSQLFEEFLIFYSEHMIDVQAQNKVSDLAKTNLKAAKTVATILIGSNLIPSIHMNTQSRKILGIASLSVLYSKIFNKTEKRVDKAINQVIQQTKPCNIVLLGSSSCHLLLDKFLQCYMPKSCIEKKSYDQLAGQLEPLLSIDISAELNRLSLKSSSWLIKLKSETLDHVCNQSTGWPRKQILMLDQGLKLFEEMDTIIGNILAAHQHQESKLTESKLIGLYRLMALVKSLRVSLKDNLDTFMVDTLVKLEQFIRNRWEILFESTQKRQIMMNYTDRKLELIWTLKLAAIASRPELMSNALGRNTLAICLPMIITVFDQNELQDLNLLLDLLRLDLDDRIASFSDCSQLYWQIPDLSTLYTHAFEELHGASSELNALHQALDDVIQMFEISEKPSWSKADINWLINERNRHLETLSNELVEQFKVNYLDRVCQEFEVELRLQIHKDLYTEDHVNLFQRHIYDFKEILEGGADSSGIPVAFRILKHRIDLKCYVENHLNKIFYNLTAIAPTDWLTYDNMMNLARHKYGLKFVETQLPVQTLDSGLDLLDIIRNLALFASRYSYDILTQTFLEKCSNRLSSATTIQSINSSFAPTSSNQSLNVLQIEHVVQSIQTHGYGIHC